MQVLLLFLICFSLAWRRISILCILSVWEKRENGVRESDRAADKDEGYSDALLNGCSHGEG
jgi:hypothetical protein